MQEELSGHTDRASKRQQVRGPLSRCGYSKWSGFRSWGLLVHASVSSASCYLRSWPGRWSRARPAAPAGKSSVQEGRASTSAPKTAPRRAGPSGLTSASRHGISAKVDGPGTDVRTASALQNQNTGSGTSTRPATAGVCSDLRFRCSPPYRSSQGSLCKSSRLSHGGPPRGVTSPGATGSLSIVQNSRIRLIRAFISLHAAWNFCSPAAYWLWNQQQRSSICRRQPSRGKSTLKEIACYCGISRHRRDGAHTVARAGGLRAPALANAMRRSESGQTAPPPQW